MDGCKRSALVRGPAAFAAFLAALTPLTACWAQTPAVDPALRQAGIGHAENAPSLQQPSGQIPCPPAKPQPTPPSAPSTPSTPMAPSYPPAAPTYAPMAPTYAPMAPTYAPMAPTYAPMAMTYAPMAPSYAPMAPSYAPAPPSYAPMTPPAPNNFFLPNATPAPPMAPTGPPMAPMAPMMPMAMVPAAAQPGGAGLANSSVSVPTTRSTSTVRVRGPSLLAAGLARLGERLTQLGRTRIETVQETVLQNAPPQPFGGVATISTTGLTPAAPPVPSVPQAPQPPSPPQGPPTPSPQGVPQKPSKHHGLFGHD